MFYRPISSSPHSSAYWCEQRMTWPNTNLWHATCRASCSLLIWAQSTRCSQWKTNRATSNLPSSCWLPWWCRAHRAREKCRPSSIFGTTTSRRCSTGEISRYVSWKNLCWKAPSIIYLALTHWLFEYKHTHDTGVLTTPPLTYIPYTVWRSLPIVLCVVLCTLSHYYNSVIVLQSELWKCHGAKTPLLHMK